MNKFSPTYLSNLREHKSDLQFIQRDIGMFFIFATFGKNPSKTCLDSQPPM